MTFKGPFQPKLFWNSMITDRVVLRWYFIRNIYYNSNPWVVMVSYESLRACVRLVLGFSHAISPCLETLCGLLPSPFSPMALTISLLSLHWSINFYSSYLNPPRPESNLIFLHWQNGPRTHFISNLSTSLNKRKIQFITSITYNTII